MTSWSSSARRAKSAKDLTSQKIDIQNRLILLSPFRRVRVEVGVRIFQDPPDVLEVVFDGTASRRIGVNLAQYQIINHCLLSRSKWSHPR